MKNIFTLLFIFFISSVQATTYYFSSLSGDDSRTAIQAQDASAPWRSLGKLNSFFSSLQPGDSVLFKRGESFYGTITISKSGTAGLPIVIGAYGTGARPVITGLTPLSNWIAVGNGIYESYNPILGTSLNILLLNDAQQPLGRYPNKGYLALESHIGKTSITDNELPSFPNWKDAELVLRSAHWIMDRYLITSHSGNTLSFAGNSEPRNNYGYFIQNSIKTLDQLGEWYYNAATKKVSMYFGASSPSSFNVGASSLDYIIYSSRQNNVSFDNLTFKGANKYAVDINSGSRFTVKNCDVLFSGIGGVSVSNHPYFIIENSTVLNSNNSGIVAGTATSAIIRNNIVKNTYSIPGMGQSGDGQGSGIRVGRGGIAEYNQIINSGFIGINFSDDSTVIKNNYIDTFCFIKDDAGAIYTSNGANITLKGRKVTGNIVLNGIGAAEGTDATVSSAEGIYMDDNANGVEITGNTVANCFRGFLFHNSRQITATNNTLYNNIESQLYMKYDGMGDRLRNHTITNNIFLAKLATQLASSINTKINDIDSIGRLDSNYYARPIDDRTVIFNATYLGSSLEDRNYRDLEGWKSEYGEDAASKRSMKQIAPYTVKSLIGSNKVAIGSFNSSADLRNLWSNSCPLSWENSGMLDSGYLKASPAATTSSIVFNVGELSSSKNYVLRYSLKGTGSMSIAANLRSSDYERITKLQYRIVSAARTENEMLFTPTRDQTNGALVLTVDAQNVYYLDNIQLFEAESVATDPDDSIRFVYNASTVARTIGLDGNYVDVKNNKFPNSIMLQPYQSAVLIKDGGFSNAAPTVSITSPVADTTLAAPASVTIRAAAADSDGTISKVEFYNNDTLLGTETASPYTFTWNNVPAGNYSITAKAIDNGSLATVSAAVAFSVFTPNVAPTVSLTSPVSGTKYTGPAIITITAAAADSDGVISKVQFYNGTTLLKTVLAAPYTFSWNNVAAGSYTITAKATDDKGLATTSVAVPVTVLQNVAPRVTITSPVVNATYKAVATINMSATATDSDGFISKVEFYNGTTLLVTERYAPFSYSWTNVPIGNYTIIAKATDNKGAITTSESVRVSVVQSTLDYTENNSVSADTTTPLARRQMSSSERQSEPVGLKLAPNPASNTIFVSGKGLPINQDLVISIVSANGAILKTIRTKVTGKAVEVNISSLSAGVYTIKAASGFITISKQFVKL